MDDVSFYQLSFLWWPDVVFPRCQHLREVCQMGKYKLQREDISNCCCFKERKIDCFFAVILEKDKSVEIQSLQRISEQMNFILITFFLSILSSIS